MMLNRAAVAEFIGTFALMFVGGGAIIVTGGDNLVAIAFAHGLILAVMVAAVFEVSGGQLNPAVSVALATIGKQPWSKAITFIAAQCMGAIAAALILKVALASAYDVGNVGATLGKLSASEVPDAVGQMGINQHASWAATVGLEVIATFFLMFVIMGTAVHGKGMRGAPAVAGLFIGLTVAADILFFGPLTGASMNPARSLGPQVVAGVWDMAWVYWVAPVAGALLAAMVYEYVLAPVIKKEAA